ncbi:MAG: peptidylprolyl isomerase [Oscillospiraceae bacterium]
MKLKLRFLLLFISMLLICQTACGTSDDKATENDSNNSSQSSTGQSEDDGSGAAADEAGDDGDETAQDTVDYDAAWKTFDKDFIVMTVNGEAVTWQEYYRWLYYIISYVEDTSGAITDWSAPCAINRKYTIAEYAKRYAESTVAQYRVVKQIAEEQNVTLTEEENKAIQDAWDKSVEEYGGEEAFLAYLKSGYSTRELYFFGQEVSYLYDDLFRSRYGENGENCTDETVAAFAESNEYVRTQYLLLKTVDEDNMLLGEEKIQEKKDRIYALSDEIAAAEDPIAKFGELYEQYNEDSMASRYPDGYTRSLSSLSSSEVRTVLSQLPENSVSQPVETGYGYYILLRLPLDYDSIVEYDKKDHTPYTLRYIAAAELFSDEIAETLASAEIHYSEELKVLDLEQLFTSHS